MSGSGGAGERGWVLKGYHFRKGGEGELLEQGPACIDGTSCVEEHSREREGPAQEL